MPASMIGPARSGRIAAVIMICQPAWQLAMMIGLPSASGWRLATSAMKADVLDRLSLDRLRQEADEIDGVSCTERHAYFTLRHHAADPRPVTGTRIDDDDRRLQGVVRRAGRRDDAHKRIVDRALERAPVNHDLGGEVQHMRRFLCRLRNLNVASLVESLEKQNAALPRVRPILRSRT